MNCPLRKRTAGKRAAGKLTAGKLTAGKLTAGKLTAANRQPRAIMRPRRLLMTAAGAAHSLWRTPMAELTGIAASPARSGMRSGPMPGGHAGRRFRFWRRAQTRPRPAALPLVLLLLALSTLFLFGGDREYFYRWHWHDRASSRALAFAENLSVRHYLTRFFHQSRDADGNLYYHPAPYNRFPIGAYVLLQPLSLLFGDADFKAAIYAGRLLMLLLFSASIILAYRALSRIIGSRWDALTAVLLAFSSYYVLFYADAISVEVAPDLFGAMLLFHGMVIFVQEGRFRQLLVKACLALLLGWHSYAFLLPFVVFGLAAELLQARPLIAARPLRLGGLKRYAGLLRRSRYLMLGIVTLLFGIAALGFNLTTEYLALDGAVAWPELPSLHSAVRTTGNDPAVNAEVSNQLTLITYLRGQSNRIATMILPYALNPYITKDALPSAAKASIPSIALGVMAVGVCLTVVALAYVRRRQKAALLLSTLTFSGLCWAVAVRTHVHFHDYEGVFYIGIPLTVFAGLLLCLRRGGHGHGHDRGRTRTRTRLAPFLAAMALLVFVFSASAMAGVGQSPEELVLDDALMADYAAIRSIVDDGETIFIPGRIKDYASDSVRWSEAYYLAGKIVNRTYDIADAARPRQSEHLGDYLLLPYRDDNPALLTPDNRRLFLYRWPLYAEQYDLTALGRPIIRGDWNVYLKDGILVYVSPKCAHRSDLFLLHLIPQDTADLRADRLQYGYDNRDFPFRSGGFTIADGTCVVARPLPNYDIAAIRTGQYRAAGAIWAEAYRLPAP